MTGALFDVTPGPVPEPVEQLSPDRRRTLRQRQRLERGIHPMKPVPLHPDAPRVTRANEPGDGPRCGACAHLYRRGDWLKCERVGATGGAGSDMRRWWPACPEWEPRETPDAPQTENVEHLSSGRNTT